MANPGRPTASHLRHQSLSQPGVGLSGSSGTGPSPMLVARVNEKRQELENLRELQQLSAQLASQMQMLDEKLSTLADGAEAIATVLANWHHVLSAISMASSQLAKTAGSKTDSKSQSIDENDSPLPETLVRIPTQQSSISSRE